MAYQTFPSLLSSVHQTCDELFEFKEVTYEDVRKVIMAMPSNKAQGYDRIPSFGIKDCLPHVLPTLTALVNLSFASSAFPSTWKKPVVVQHPKTGDHKIPNNDRPISLLPILSKVTEKSALNQFNGFLTQLGNLTCYQSRNRKHHYRNPESACYWSYFQSNGPEGNNSYSPDRSKQGIL